MAGSLALFGGEPVRRRPFQAWPVHGHRERELVLEVLADGDWSFDGPREQEFTDRFSAFCGAAAAFCVTSGTVALEVALRALGIGPGDEVIVPALTWIAAAYAVIQAGARPVFADVRDDDWCIDPDAVEGLIGPATRAVITVHNYCLMTDMDRLLEVAGRRSLRVVEDCAHALGSQWCGRPAGSLADAGTFSFQQSKLITSGEGGALVTNDLDLAHRIYRAKNCGRPWRGEGEPGFGGNYRITELQAAVLIAQLERFEAQAAVRTANAAWLRRELGGLCGFEALAEKPQVTRSGHYGLSLRIDEAVFPQGNEAVAAALVAEGIPVYTPGFVVYRCPLWSSGMAEPALGPLPQARARLGLDADCPRAERIAQRVGLVIRHDVLLSPKRDLTDVLAALDKLSRHAAALDEWTP